MSVISSWAVPTVPQDLCLPSFKTEERAWNQQRAISGITGGGTYMSEIGSCSDVLLCAADSGQDLVAVFTPRLEVGRVPVMRH